MFGSEFISQLRSLPRLGSRVADPGLGCLLDPAAPAAHGGIGGRAANVRSSALATNQYGVFNILWTRLTV